MLDAGSLDGLASPDQYPLRLALAADQVEFTGLDEGRYRSASFLDERILADDGAKVAIAWTVVEQIADDIPSEADFIFHTGHVGSTLLSRLLGEASDVFSVREPAILRAFAHMELDLDRAGAPWGRKRFDRRLLSTVRLLSRVYRKPQRAIIKATSFVAEIAPNLLLQSPGARAVLMFVPPQVHLATILAGAASRAELRVAIPTRLERLHRRLGARRWRAGDLSPGEMAALGWACEVCALSAAASRFGERVLWLDFDQFLAAPSERLGAILLHLRRRADPRTITRLLQSSILGVYSKAPDQPYHAALRREIISRASVEHREEIERGLAWLNAAGQDHREIADAARAAAAARQAA